MYLADTSITPRKEFATSIVLTVTITFFTLTGAVGVENFVVVHADPFQYNWKTPLDGTVAFVDIVD
jgi:hypothetical protein